jgi:hypothetical protein
MYTKYHRLSPGKITLPKKAEREETVGSPLPKSGAVMLPPTALFVNSRLSVPEVHRTPMP